MGLAGQETEVHVLTLIDAASKLSKKGEASHPTYWMGFGQREPHGPNFDHFRLATRLLMFSLSLHEKARVT